MSALLENNDLLTSEMSNDDDIIQISKFNVESMFYDRHGNYLNPKICILGPNNCGKSWLIKDILFMTKELENMMVFCDNTDLKFYNNFISNNKTCLDCDMDVLNGFLLEHQNNKKYIVLDKVNCQNKGEYQKMNNIFLDKNKEFTIIYSNTIDNIKYIRNLKYFDYIFVFSDLDISNRKNVYDVFCNIKTIPNFRAFDQIYNQIANEHECMVINNTIKVNDISSKFFWYKAYERTNFNTNYHFSIDSQSISNDGYLVYYKDHKKSKQINYELKKYKQDLRLFYILNS